MDANADKDVLDRLTQVDRYLMSKGCREMANITYLARAEIKALRRQNAQLIADALTAKKVDEGVEVLEDIVAGRY